MWITFTIALSISLIAGYLFLTAHRRRPRALEGIVVLTSTMICLGVAPVPIKVVLLVAIFSVEGWRLRWEKAQPKEKLREKTREKTGNHSAA